MTTSPTVDQLTEVSDTDSMVTFLLSMLTASGAEIDVTAWDEDSALRAMVYAMAVFAADRTRVTALLARGRYLDDATGDWLTAKALSDFDLTRNPAVKTAGDFVLTPDATASLPQSIAIGELVFVDSATENTYRNTTAGTLSTAGVGVTFTVESEVTGSDTVIGTSIATISLVTPIPGVTVTNPAISGTSSWISTQGANEETNIALRARCRARWSTLTISGGPRDAYEYWARTADTAVTRVQVDDQDLTGTGQVGVYVASDGGAPSASVVTNVDEYINGKASPFIAKKHPIGATVTVSAASNVSVTLGGTVTVLGQYAATIQETLEAAFDTCFDQVPVGGTKLTSGAADGYVLLSDLYKTAMAVPGVVNFAFSTPLADTPLTVGQVAVPATYPTFTPNVI